MAGLIHTNYVRASRHCIESRVELDAWQAEDHPHAVCVERVYQQVGASDYRHRSIVGAHYVAVHDVRRRSVNLFLSPTVTM